MLTRFRLRLRIVWREPKWRKAIESTEVALIIGVVVLVAYGAYVLLGSRIADVVRQIAEAI